MFIAQARDKPLDASPAYSEREIIFMLEHEKVERLDDLLLRRTLLAMLGQIMPALLQELAGTLRGYARLVRRASKRRR